MTITNPNAYTRDTANWTHSTFVVTLGTEYKTYKEIVAATSQDETFSDGVDPVIDPVVLKLINDTGQNGTEPVYFSKRKCRDTTLGGNDAINCDYQYCENDDIMHAFNFADQQGTTGLGRVYSETLDDTQQILYMSFGIPVFNNLTTFYRNAVDRSLADLMNKGPSFVSFEKIGQLFGSIANSLVTIPTIPLVWLDGLLNNFNNTQVTKYYDFNCQQPMYYKFVNTILITLGVNLGMMENPKYVKDLSLDTGSKTSALSHQQLMQSANAQSSGSGTPDWISEYQLDIFRIMARKRSYEKGDASVMSSRSTDQAVRDLAGKDTTGTASQDENTPGIAEKVINWTSQLFTGFALSGSGAIHHTDMFIGLKISRTSAVHESFSNNYSKPDIADVVNGKLSSAKQAKFSAMDGNITGSGVLNAIQGGISGVLGGITSTFGLGGLTALATGSGMVDFPDTWDTSSFSRSYSFSLKLRSPYGDPISILQSIYFPIACIVAGACPRTIGLNAYTSPFYVRAYCKGLFSSPLCAIDSLGIDRAGGVNSITYQRLPTEVNLSFSLKDMAPVMHMAMGSNEGLYDSILGQNSAFQEWLATLAGLGMAERVDILAVRSRKMAILAQTLMSTKLNGYYWGMMAGNSAPMRFLFNVIPVTRYIPNT